MEFLVNSGFQKFPGRKVTAKTKWEVFAPTSSIPLNPCSI